MKKIRVAPNNSLHDLPLWVAESEGLFATEGLDVEFIQEDRNIERPTQGENPTNVPSVILQGQKETLIEKGHADVYNACEWGCIIRANASDSKAKIMNRRPVVFAHTLLVHNDSPVQLPEDLAEKSIGVTWPSGNYFMAYRMLEGYLPTNQIKTVDMGGRHKTFEAFMDRKVDAIITFEPFTSLAEKLGARAIVEGFDQGQEMGSLDLDVHTRRKWISAVSKAVEKINTNPSRYYAKVIRSEIPDQIKSTEVNWKRVRFVMPTPYTADQFELAYAWMKQHDMIQAGAIYKDLAFTD